MGTHVLQSEMRARHGHPSSASDTVCVCVCGKGGRKATEEARSRRGAAHGRRRVQSMNGHRRPHR
jgi:hypothetical protein